MKMLAPQMPPPPLYVKKICPIQSGNVDNLTLENDLLIDFVSMCETEQLLLKGYQKKIEETPLHTKIQSILIWMVIPCGCWKIYSTYMYFQRKYVGTPLFVL